MNLNKRIWLGAAISLLGATCAVADEAAPANSKPFASAKPVTELALKDIRGKAELSQVVVAENTSVVSGNSVSGVSNTGKIEFDRHSFQDLRGLSVLSANTGNNVSINSSLNVNVAIRQ